MTTRGWWRDYAPYLIAVPFVLIVWVLCLPATIIESLAWALYSAADFANPPRPRGRL